MVLAPVLCCVLFLCLVHYCFGVVDCICFLVLLLCVFYMVIMCVFDVIVSMCACCLRLCSCFVV